MPPLGATASRSARALTRPWLKLDLAHIAAGARRRAGPRALRPPMVGAPAPTTRPRSTATASACGHAAAAASGCSRVVGDCSAWGKQLGAGTFRESFEQLAHGASGIVFLNEHGFDRLVVGDKMPDPNTGKRIVDPTGISWNNDQGYELGGIGCSKTAEGKYRVVMGMDDPTVGEALHLFVLEDGTKGLRIASEDSLLLIGRARANNEIFGNTAEFAGLMIKDASGEVVLEQNALGK